jgi:hypothetical protein
MGIHASSRAIKTLYSRGIGNVVAKLFKGLIDPWPTTMNFTDLNGFKFLALAMFDYLDMG